MSASLVGLNSATIRQPGSRAPPQLWRPRTRFLTYRGGRALSDYGSCATAGECLLAQLRLDLPHALAGHAEALAHLVEQVNLANVMAVAQATT